MMGRSRGAVVIARLLMVCRCLSVAEMGKKLLCLFAQIIADGVTRLIRPINSIRATSSPIG